MPAPTQQDELISRLMADKSSLEQELIAARNRGREPVPQTAVEAINLLLWRLGVELDVTGESFPTVKAAEAIANHLVGDSVPAYNRRVVAEAIQAERNETDRVQRELAAVRRQVHRLVHDEEIESDRICDHELELQHFRDRVREVLLGRIRHNEPRGFEQRVLEVFRIATELGINLEEWE